MTPPELRAIEPDAALAIYDEPVHRITVEFGDCDPAGIVFYPNFFRWFDQATWRLFDRAGYSRAVLTDRFGLLGHPLVKTGAEFLKPADQGTELAIESRILRWGRTSFDIGHLLRGSGGAAHAKGTETRIWAGPGEGERKITALPVPEEVKTRLPARPWDEG